MNQTGVASTGSRRQARRNRSFTSVYDEGLGQRDQILEPERLEPDRRAERLQLVLDRVRQEVVAGDDRDRDVDGMRLRRTSAEKLQAVGDRHPHVEDDGVGRTLSASSSPARRMAVATPKPSSLSIRANVSATDRSSSTIRIVAWWRLRSRLSAGGDHRIILSWQDVKRGLRAGARTLGTRASNFPVLMMPGSVAPGGEVSPILVRPVREQLEHDRVIRLLQVKLKRKHDVVIEYRRGSDGSGAHRARCRFFPTWC